MPRCRALFLAPLVAATLGCSTQTEPGVAVSGRVTYQGKPVKEAAIFFTPDPDKPGKGGHGLISDGRYAIPAEDGPYPGPFNVIIVDPRRDNPSYRKDSIEPMISERYRAFGAIRVTIPARKSYSFDFQLD